MQIHSYLHKPTQRAERAGERAGGCVEPNELLSTAIWWEKPGRSRGEHTLYDSVIFIFHSRLVTHYLADHATASR